MKTKRSRQLAPVASPAESGGPPAGPRPSCRSVMLGSGDPTPYDLPVTALLVVLAIFLVLGAGAGKSWPAGRAALLRRGTLTLALAAAGAVHVLAPTINGIVGAGRLLTLWPALALVVLAYGAWAWRVGRP